MPESLKLESRILDYLRGKRGQTVVLCQAVSVLAKELGEDRTVRARRKIVYAALNRCIKQRQVVKSKDWRTVRISELVA